MRIERVWAMPSRWTFQIKPIKKLVKRYAGDGRGWFDPFAGNYSPAEFTNDINPKCKAKQHLHAVEFCKSLTGTYEGAIFDPPYSLRQVKECYLKLGLEMSFEDSKMFPTNVKNLIAPKIAPGGYAICCGWNSTGLGKERGFKLVEILIVCHGGRHNDTIVTVEQKINGVIS